MELNHGILEDENKYQLKAADNLHYFRNLWRDMIVAAVILSYFFKLSSWIIISVNIVADICILLGLIDCMYGCRLLAAERCDELPPRLIIDCRFLHQLSDSYQSRFLRYRITSSF